MLYKKRPSHSMHYGDNPSNMYREHEQEQYRELAVIHFVIVFRTEISRCVNTHTMFAQNVTTITIRFHVSVTDYYIYIYMW